LTIYNLATYSYYLKDNDEASNYFQQVTNLAPNNPIAQFGLGCSYYRLRKAEYLQALLEV
jgi:tetratricopeptide (TPR) repeat protein